MDSLSFLFFFLRDTLETQTQIEFLYLRVSQEGRKQRKQSKKENKYESSSGSIRTIHSIFKF